MRVAVGMLVAVIAAMTCPSLAQYPPRGPYPQQEECPQGRQLRQQQYFPPQMTDCQVLDADTAEQRRLRRQSDPAQVRPPPGAPPAAYPPQAAPAVVKNEDPRQHEIDEDLKLGYATITFEDFALDTKELIKTGKKIAILGYYRKTGNFEELFASPIAAIQSDAMPSSTRIALLAEDTPRDLRAYYLRCSNNPATASIGCWTRVRGHVSTCEVKLLGLSGEKPCLIVEGGWSMNSFGGENLGRESAGPKPTPTVERTLCQMQNSMSCIVLWENF